VIGALFDHVYADGNPTSVLNGLQTYNVAPGAGAMFELRVPDEGLYPFVTHSFAYTDRGSVGVLQVTDDAPPAPAEYPSFGDPFTAGVLEYGATPAVVSSAEGEGSQPQDGPVVVEAAISGFDPAELEVAEGKVAIQLVNLDAFDHDFTIDELDVKVVMGPSETVDSTIDSTPGTYTFYCSIPGHREAGMEGTITVLPSVGH
jgi:plastocyanin